MVPRNVLLMMLLLIFLVPPRLVCSVFKNQDRNSTLSPTGTMSNDEKLNMSPIGRMIRHLLVSHSCKRFWVALQLHWSNYGQKRASLTTPFISIPCCVIWNFFLLQSTTACSISCGLTWALKLRGFHSLRINSPNRCTSRNIWSPGGRFLARAA